MKATELLQKQHREIEQLLERHKSATMDQREAIRDELASLLVAHTVIEEEHFYPALREAAPELVQEAIEEHGLASYQLARDIGARGRGREDRARAKAIVLAQVVGSHIRKEETDLFRRAENALTNQDLAELGELMERRFLQVRTLGYKRFLAQAVAENLPRLAVRAPIKAKRAATAKKAAKTRRAAPKRVTAAKARRTTQRAKQGTAKRVSQGTKRTPQATAKRGRPQRARAQGAKPQGARAQGARTPRARPESARPEARAGARHDGAASGPKPRRSAGARSRAARG